MNNFPVLNLEQIRTMDFSQDDELDLATATRSFLDEAYYYYAAHRS